jgi:hypothetical protein
MVSSAIYVVASGASLRGFDFELLRGGEIVTVNDNYQWIPFAQHLVILDKPFFKKHLEGLTNFEGKIYNDRGIPGCLSIPTTHINNSGYSALLLALSFHPKVIHLLGFDLCRITYSHHFDELPAPSYTNFQEVAEAIDRIDTKIRIINYSDISILKRFPKRPLAELPLPKGNKNSLTGK